MILRVASAAIRSMRNGYSPAASSVSWGDIMTLAVIGTGFGRTGTMSLKRALDELGYGPCHHMKEVFAHPEQVAHWQAIAAGQPVKWDEVFAGYRSQVDWPGAHVWRETAAAYPKAKVIHTVRSEELWWKSFSGTIAKLMSAYEDMPLPSHVRAMLDVAMELIGDKTFHGKAADKDGAITAYRRRAEDVRAAIPPERLLVFDVADGWEPLRRFLGHKVPKTLFPRTNSARNTLDRDRLLLSRVASVIRNGTPHLQALTKPDLTPRAVGVHYSTGGFHVHVTGETAIAFSLVSMASITGAV
jgi:Sulfotransferase domain